MKAFIEHLPFKQSCLMLEIQKKTCLVIEFFTRRLGHIQISRKSAYGMKELNLWECPILKKYCDCCGWHLGYYLVMVSEEA
jgi:hypothetical protein